MTERTCESCEHSTMYWPPKGATPRLVCKRVNNISCVFARMEPLDLKFGDPCGPEGKFWKQKETV